MTRETVEGWSEISGQAAMLRMESETRQSGGGD